MDLSRKTALDILISCERDKSYINLALKKHLRDIKNSTEKSFITALVYGVTQQRLLLDYYIGSVSSVKTAKINIVVMNILRIGLYQLMFMSTPPSAACNTSVELAKANGQQKSSGFVNAILRRLSRELDSIEKPTRQDIRLSVSPQVWKLLCQSFGCDGAEKYLDSSVKHDSVIYAAVNTLKISAISLIDELAKENIVAEQTEHNGLIRIISQFSVEASTAYTAGLFHIIGLPSYITACTLDPKPGETIYDLCAAPGGKSFALSYLSDGKARIKAFDIHKHKTDRMNTECKRLGLADIQTITSDSSIFDQTLRCSADRVLCDVPCSGLGVIGKKPDIRYKSIDLDSLNDIQLKILTNGAKYLKPHGRLVYSTCTVTPEENRLLIDKFLTQNRGYEIDNEVIIFGDKRGDMQFVPDGEIREGFYICVITKRGVDHST